MLVETTHLTELETMSIDDMTKTCWRNGHAWLSTALGRLWPPKQQWPPDGRGAAAVREWWWGGEGGWRWLLCLTFILRLSDFCPLTQRQDNREVARRGRKKGSSVGLTDEQTSVAVTVTLSRLSSGSEQQCRPERLLRRYVPVLQQSSELYTYVRNRCSTGKKIYGKKQLQIHMNSISS